MIEQKRATSREFINGELQRLTKELELQVSSGDFPTLDEQLGLINKMKEAFFHALRKTYTSNIIFEQFDILNPVKQRLMVKSINWDIAGAYNRLEDSQVDLQNRINKFSSLRRQVEDRVSRANGVVQSTSVLNDIGVFEIGDTFNDLNRIDIENPSSVQAMYQSKLGGILTLPREGAENITPANVIIMDSSNGFVPDGQELDSLIDNNPDTWLEYHRKAIDQDDSEKLTLDILIKLKLPTIINLLRISPLVLDDKAFPIIETIETSIDGRVYQDIRDSIPNFITKDEEDTLFTLGPVGFRNQSAAEFVITPRTCQFIRIRIQQSKKTKQADETFRQIIALRDINIQQVRYQDRGELLTTALPLPFLAKRVLVSQRAAQTEPLTTVAYQISLDGGATYAPILVDTPLEINTGAPTSISVDGQKREARLRLTAVRDTENFNGIAAPLASTVRTVRENLPLGPMPIVFTLENLPVQDTLQVFRPIATIGKENEGTLISNGGGQDNQTIVLPIKPEPFTETIKVNGYTWSRVPSFDDSDPDSTDYTIDYNTGILHFGNNTQGQIPESEIRLEVPAEKVVIPDTSPFEITLKNSHSYDASNTSIEWTGKETSVLQEVLRKDEVTHTLAHKNIAESVLVREEVPKGVTSFILGHIPLDKDDLEFDDTVVFADGAWSTAQLISDNDLSPVTVTTTSATDTEFPGYVEYNAVARIVNKRSSYNAELYDTSELEIYRPNFNTDAFSTEQTFINGKNELTQAGDYSIDYESGIVYSFSNTPTDGNSYINYFYHPKNDLSWEFGSHSKSIVINDDSVIVNKNNLTTAVVKQDNIQYFVVFKDNRFVWLPFDEQYVSNLSNSFSTVNSDADHRPLQDTIPQTDFTFVPDDDFIKGAVLPAGKTRVGLEHNQIVKNSVRFIFVSDDINSFDDRIVTKDSDLNITVSPKPVKDVYGNSITGSNVGVSTQRDEDMAKLVREVQFINGNDELLTGGDYSLDYENGILYTTDPIPAHTIIQYEFSDISVSYVASKELNKVVDFDVNIKNLEVSVNNLDEALETPNGSIIIRYNVIENFAQDPAKILRYYTPIVYGYKLKASKG